MASLVATTINGELTLASPGKIIFSALSNIYLQAGTNSIALKNSGGTVLWNSSNQVPASGGTFTGDITISKSVPKFTLVNTASSSKTWDILGNGTSFYITEASVADRLLIQAGGNVTFTSNVFRVQSASSTDMLVRINSGSSEVDSRLMIGEGDNYGMTLEYDGVANIGYLGMNDNVAPTGAWSKRIQMSRGGTEVAFMAGSVGIGTASPSLKFQVHSGDILITSGKQLITNNAYTNAPPAMLTVQGPSTGNPTLSSNQWGIMIGPQHNRATTANSYYPGIAFNMLLNHSNATTYNNAPNAWIGTRLHDTSGSERAFLVFSTKGGTGTTASDVPLERMCIDPVNGSVGIGTTDPAAELQIGRPQTTSAFTDSFIKLRPSSTTNSTGLTSITFGTSTVDNYGYSISGWRAGTDGAPYLAIKYHNNSAAGVDAMVMDNLGNVGIGSNAPPTKFHVLGNTGHTQVVNIKSTLTTGGCYMQFTNATAELGYFGWGSTGNNDCYIVNTGGSNTGAIRLYAGGNTRLLVNANGNVEINDGNFTIASGHLLYLDGGGDTYIYEDTANSISIATNSTVRMTLNHNGVVVNDNILYFGSTSGGFVYNDSSVMRLAGDAGIKLQTYVGGWQDRLVILDGGSVGIGNATPNKTFEVKYASTSTNVTGEGLNGGGAGTGILIHNSQASNSVYANLDFRANNADGRIAYQYQTATNVGDFHFITDNTGSPQSMMTIKNDGKVGIGTVDPGGRLAIRTTANEKSLWMAPSGATTANVLHMECDSLTTGSGVYIHSNTSNSSGRKLVYINNDHSSATGTTCLYINQDSTGPAINIDKTNVASAGDFDFIKLDYSGSWGSNLGGIAAISATDGNGIIGRYGIAYASAGGRFVVTDLYDGGYGASGDVFYVKGDGEAYIQGNLGIGMSPTNTYRLAVTGTNNTPVQILSTANNCNLTLGNSTQTQYTNIMFNSSSGNAQIWKAGGSYTAFGGASSLNLYSSNGNIAFHTNGNANRATLDTSGNFTVAVGNISTSNSSNGYIAARTYLQLTSSVTPTSGSYIGKLYAYNNQGAQLNYKDGYNTNHALHSASDYRLKENITDYSSDDAVSLVKAAKVKRFDYIAGSEVEENRTNRVGFLAHELQEAGCDLGAVVSLQKNAVDNLGNPRMQSVDYKNLVPVLWSALQDALKRIEILENK